MSNHEHIGKTEGEFSTVQFFDDGSSEYVRRWVSAQEAVEAAQHYVTCPAARVGIIIKVIVTDGGDYTVFAWERDQGIYWPEETKHFGKFNYEAK